MIQKIYKTATKWNALNLNLKNRSCNSRDNCSLVIGIHYRELKEKPISYWTNINESKRSNLIRIVNTIKCILGISWDNNVLRLYYYNGSRVFSPYTLQFFKDSFVLKVYPLNGSGNDVLTISRKITKNKDRYFTEDEIKTIGNYIEKHYNLFLDRYCRHIAKNT
jgi:hypothetical protein